MHARVVIYTRAGCDLCAQARSVVAAVCDELGESWTEVDIDADDALRSRYTDFVPVVEVDGKQVGFWRVKAENVRAALSITG